MVKKELQQIIGTSTFEVKKGKFVYTKVKSVKDLDKHFMISRDNDEITIVTEEENFKNLDLLEKNKDYWALIALNVSAPFYSVGFLATVSSAIAKQDMSVLIISTYSKDYIMVRYDLLDKAREALLDLGFKET